MLRSALIAGAALAALACGGSADKNTPPPPPPPPTPSAAIMNPDAAAMAKAAPDSFDVVFATGKGEFVVRAYRHWSAAGADRFHYLVSNGYYDRVKFFRNIDGFMVQFGIHGDPKVNTIWSERGIKDEPVKSSNVPGTVTYAMSTQPNSRTTQLFINKNNNSALDKSGFAPFGKVISGMDVVMKLYSLYGEGAPRGIGPDQGLIQSQGNAYLNKEYPLLDSIITARVK
jgi:peptidyl-prolyl cis-trans isomerase A (cyclophilin A)